MNANAVKYSLAGSGSAPPNFSASLPDAPAVVDSSPGDTSSGYTQAAASPANLCVNYDLGANTQVNAVRASFTGATGVNVFTSTDGVNWGYGPAITGLTSGGQTNLGVNCRYVAFVVAGNGGERISDARLYDGAGALINPPPGLVSAAGSLPCPGCPPTVPY